MPEIRDDIPRVQQLAPHLQALLLAMVREGATFEQARQRYIAHVDHLVAQGLGRRAASRVGDAVAFWSPTKELLEEGMRLSLVDRQPLPSARAYVEAYRERRYALTAAGAEMADLAQRDTAGFYDHLTDALFDAHAYFRHLLEALIERPLVCPMVTEGEVEEARRARRGLAHWVERAADRMGEPKPDEADRRRITERIEAAVRKRFDGRRATSKEVSETLDDAFTSAAAVLRGLDFGAFELNMLRHWGVQLRILDQSRYVPEYPGANVIWLAADIHPDSNPHIVRHVRSLHEQAAAEAVLEAYRREAESSNSSLSAPYIPIYRVRAAAAFRCGVTRGLIDMVIERLAAGALPGQKAEVHLHLGHTRQPLSEPVYRRGHARSYEITIVNP